MKYNKNQILKGLAIFSIFLVLLVLQAATAQSAVPPEFERLQPISDKLNAPTSVALDSHENIYITESSENRLHKFSQSGQHLKMLGGLSEPLGVAVDDAGRIYVGNKGRGNVEVYAPDFTLLRKCGDGDGEFKHPVAIAIDSAGSIYVVDSKENTVRVYNPDCSYKFSFGSYGSEDGQFSFPTSIAINEISGELIIADFHLVQGWMGLSERVKVQIFDMNGVFKRSFGEYGIGEGLLNRPMGVAVDRSERIYISDAYEHAVQVFDRDGVSLGIIFDPDSPRTPLGIKLGESNRLFIASMNGGKVEAYGIDQYTQMEVSPLSLSFTAKQSGDVPLFQYVEINNNGNETLNWTAATDDDWITISEVSGSTEPSAMSISGIGIDLTGLEAGTYAGSVIIQSEAGPAETVDITLTVEAMPELSVTPSSLEFTSLNGTTPPSQNLSISDAAGVSNFEWAALSEEGWIVLDKTSGTAPDTIVVSADISSLGEGTYTGDITVRADDVMSSPANIPVILDIIRAKGQIKVKTNLKKATFAINGPESYAGSGKNWKVKGVPEGTYSIVFGHVQGYVTPSSQSRTLEKDKKITFKGEYEEIEDDKDQSFIKSSKHIITGAGPGGENAGFVKVFNHEGDEAGVEFLAHTYTHGVNVAAGDINNDGIDEIITAPGPGPDNPAELNIFDNNGNKLTDLTVTVFPHMYGAQVASGDLNCDGYAEVIVGAGTGGGNPAEVKVFVYDPMEEKLIDSGINMLAYGSGDGVRVAAGDMDCDSISEIITAPGTTDSKNTEVRIWKVDTSGGMGNWNASLFKEFIVKSRYKNGVNIAAYDINGDGSGEILTGSGPHSNASSEIRVFDAEGDLILNFGAEVSEEYGATAAGGDLDGDGEGEIVVGAGPGESNSAEVRVFDSNGKEKAGFRAMDTGYGVNVAVGNLGID